MIYSGEFISKDGHQCRIEIQNKKMLANQTLTLAGTPFTTCIDKGDDILYTPIRCGGATVTVLTEVPLLDMYSANATDIKVTFTRDGIVQWRGFVCPTMYDQSFDREKEKVQIDCVDGLAVLKSIPYRTQKRERLPLLEVIRKCLRSSDCYSTLWISDNVQLTPTGTQALCESLRISENNFFEKKEDEAQTDDDVAWSCYDVLAEIMRWLGLTMVADGDNVMCIDYDAIKAGEPAYYRYSLEQGAPATGTRYGSLTARHHITGAAYAKSGTRLSLDRIFNKVTVVDDFRTIENVIPKLGDPLYETNITMGTDTVMGGVLPSGWVYNLFTTYERIVNGKYDNFQIFTCSAKFGSVYQRYVVIVKFMKSDILKFHHYGFGASPNTLLDMTDLCEEGMCWGRMMQMRGATYVKLYRRQITDEEYADLMDRYERAGRPSHAQDRFDVYCQFLNITNPEQVELKPMIIFYDPNDGGKRIGPAAYDRTGNFESVSGQGSDLEDCQRYPAVTLRKRGLDMVFGGENTYLVLKGNYQQHAIREAPFPLDPKDNEELEYKKSNKARTSCFMWMELKWGDHYLDASGEWFANRRFYKIPWIHQVKPAVLVTDYFAKDFKLFDTTAAKMITDADGVYIKTHSSSFNVNLVGEPELTLYMNHDSRSFIPNVTETAQNNSWSKYYNEVQILTDFSADIIVNNGGVLNEADLSSDTVYVNETESGSIDPMDDITFKVCTYDGKSFSYAVVDIGGDLSTQFVGNLYNKALYPSQGTPMRQEEHLVFKCVTQYSAPRKVLECNLKTEGGHKLYGIYTDTSLAGPSFVITAMETDWKMDRTNLTLLEKA